MSLPVDPAQEAMRIRRRKIIISVIVVSLVIHLLGGIGATFWIIARYFEKPKATFELKQQIRIDPEERQHRVEMAEMESLRPKPVVNNRIQSLRPTSFALPELPQIPVEDTPPIDPNALITENMDSLVSARTGTGLGAGGGFFGGAGKAGSGLLEGTYYDFKFTDSGRDTEMDPERMAGILREFSDSWDTTVFDPYYRANRNLYASRTVMPAKDAQDAPKAFKVNKPGRLWVVHYKGKVRAPESGTYRFVGVADDYLLVRFNGRLVLDASIAPVGSMPGEQEIRPFAPYFDDPKLNEVYLEYIKGHRVGRTFEVRKGDVFDLEVLVGESPGGQFYAFLFIERVGGSYDKDPAGQPIVPFFEMIEGERGTKLDGKAPPASPGTEFWQPVATPESLGRSDIPN